MKRQPRNQKTKGASVVLTVMVGNSRTSAVSWSGSGRISGRAAWPTATGGKALARKIAALLRAPESTAVVLAGVVPSVIREWSLALRRVTRAHAVRLLRFRENLACPLRIRPRPAWRVGDDRLAAALGALALDPRVPWVVLDAGTALTVNAVRPGAGGRGPRRVTGTFEGGLIVPGEHLALFALGGGTAQLPALTPLRGPALPVWGCSTKDAIRVGVRRVQLAAAVELARAQAQALGARTRVVLTGGGARVLWPALRKKLASRRPCFDSDLVHRGLVLAYAAAFPAFTPEDCGSLPSP